MNPLWSFGLTALGLIGFYLSGKMNYWGWGLNVLAQFVWITYAIVTAQWGFIFSALFYGFMFGMNFYKWRKKEKTNEKELVTNG